MNLDPRFSRLVHAMFESHDAQFAPLDHTAATEDLYGATEGVETSLETEAMPEETVENLSALIGSAYRLAAVICPEIPDQTFARMIAENSTDTDGALHGCPSGIKPLICRLMQLLKDWQAEEAMFKAKNNDEASVVMSACRLHLGEVLTEFFEELHGVTSTEAPV